MKKIIVIFVIISMITAFLNFICLPQPVLAGNFLDLKQQEGFKGGEIPNAFDEDSKPTDVRHIIAQIIKGALGLLAIMFLILLVYAGFKWMTAGGNEDQITEARKLIIQAVIGLIIIMCAYAITVFIFELMVKGVDDFWIFD